MWFELHDFNYAIKILQKLWNFWFVIENPQNNSFKQLAIR